MYNAISTAIMCTHSHGVRRMPDLLFLWQQVNGHCVMELIRVSLTA